MNLPFLSKKKENKEFFLTLLLSSGKVSSILFEKTGSKLLILGASTQEFEGSLDALPPQKLLEFSDVVISSVEEKLPAGDELSKTIFAVPYNWVYEGKIVKEKLASLKTLCDELKLTPVGFIVSLEAIIALLHRLEGAPVTAIFVEAHEKHVTASIVKNGSILGVFETAIEADAAQAIDSLLLSQNVVENLPPKIVLLNFEHAKKIQQSVLSHSWSKSLSFLHIPQVDVLDSEIESQAVIAGVSSQMGFAEIPHVKLDKIEKTQSPIAVAVEEPLAQTQEDVDLADVKLDEAEVVEESVEVRSEEFGFFKDRDVLQEKTETADVVLEQVKEAEVEEELPMVHTNDGQNAKRFLPHAKFPTFSMPEFKLPFSLKSLPKSKGPLLYPLIAVVVLIIGVVGYYYAFEKVEVLVTLDKREISQEMDVEFVVDSETSAQNGVIKISEKEVKVEGSEEKAATGKKETGETAKGEVTIYNKTEDKKVFPKGSVIIGPNNLLFELTDEVSVASTSSFSTTFSNAKGKVEASKFGKEYNIPSNTNFSFENLSTANFFAKNDQAFSGGTKQEIKVVSENDINELTTKIVSSLTQKAIDQEKGAMADGNTLLSQALNYAFDEKNFSKEEGQEASSVSLTAALTLTLGYIDKEEISKFAQDAGESVPSSYTYSVSDSEVEIADIAENDDGNISGTINMKSVFVPKVSVSESVEKLIGKSEGRVSEIVTIEGVSNTQVVFTRSLPFMPKVLPFNKNNISVVVRAD